METTLNDTLTARVEAALDTIRPYLLTDGGNVNVVEITDDNVVRLELVGACSSCSMSAMTFKAGIEDAIRRAVPEVTRIEALNVAGLRS
jgi:Fe-S cluster biogenesis protein NfuA